jgi:transposase
VTSDESPAAGDSSQAEVGADFDISVQSVRRWVRRADIDGASSTGRPAPSDQGW